MIENLQSYQFKKVTAINKPLSAITLETGFMIAESAVIGLLIGFWGSFRSMITTCDCSPTFSRTQINLSLSIVKVLKPIDAA